MKSDRKTLLEECHIEGITEQKNSVIPRHVNTQVKPVEINSNREEILLQVFNKSLHVFESNFGHLYCSLVSLFF